ncbi:response regulator [Chitiniphilus purpureus]|uniref:Response regulator n=1 Tax=Chitiniphilus purpureus TaxID=2981137 RepID=A0ABY6DPD7_9NEIS|nr:tetratricopeptide repeat protein [Chitiniphilus sp. CD1]UXY16229.1 response regulator [Chitiniphilus sp. CD1]
MAEQAPTLAGCRALIIDRASEMRSALGQGLSACGVTQIDYAMRISDALARINQSGYDVVLCEYDLGQGFDGVHLFETCQRHQLLKPSAIFMVVTGERRLAQVMSAAELAPDGYLLKPFSGGEFVARIERALGRKGRFRRIDDAVRAGDYLAAIAACDKAIADAPPDMIDFRRMKGRLLAQVGEHAAARDLYRELLAERDAPWALLGLGRAQFALRQFDEARLCFQQVREAHELVIEAYDWLSRTLAAQGDAKAAQAVLQEAVRRSPLVAQRQRALGRLAHRNGDLAGAEQGLSQAIELARNSFWRDPAVYGELARIQLERGDLGAARRTGTRLKHDFRGDVAADVVVQLVDAAVSQQLGDDNKAERDKARVLLTQACEQLDGWVDAPAGVLLEAAHACCAARLRDLGEGYIRKALRADHDNLELVASVEGLFQALGDAEAGRALIAAATQDILELNNQAVRAAQAGDLAGAAERFVQALGSLPGNVQVLLNAVHAILALVNRDGWHPQYMVLAEQYLVRAKQLDPANGRTRQLIDAYRRTQRRYGVDAPTAAGDLAA